jgi:hypothetical protein
MAVISRRRRRIPNIQALYLGEAKRKMLLNEFLIPAKSEHEAHRDKAFRKVEILVVCDMLLTGTTRYPAGLVPRQEVAEPHAAADHCAREPALQRVEGPRPGAGLLRHLR